MKFKFGNYTGLNDLGCFNRSVYPLTLDTNIFKPKTTLKMISDTIKEYYDIKDGEVELIIQFKYVKRAEEHDT